MLRLIAASLMVLFSASWGAGAARAIAPPDPERLGLVAVVSGQSVALHVVNLAAPADPDKTATVVLTLFDETGTIVATTTETIEPGRAATLVVERGKIPGNTEGRAMVWGLIAPPEPDKPGKKNKVRLVTTLEVFDTASGKTSFALQAPPEPE